MEMLGGRGDVSRGLKCNAAGMAVMRTTKTRIAKTAESLRHMLMPTKLYREMICSRMKDVKAVYHIESH